MTRVLMIIASNGFRDEEYFVPKEAFEDAGFKVITASSKDMAQSKFGVMQACDLTLDECDDSFDALVLVGGPGTVEYFDNTAVHALAKQYVESKKIVAAICAAPSILANAGLLKGVHCTSFSGETSNLKQKGAIVLNEDVVQDEDIITANGPDAAEQFAHTIINELQ